MTACGARIVTGSEWLCRPFETSKPYGPLRGPSRPRVLGVGRGRPLRAPTGFPEPIPGPSEPMRELQPQSRLSQITTEGHE